jgi:hypothetical protein
MLYAAAVVVVVMSAFIRAVFWADKGPDGPKSASRL